MAIAGSLTDLIRVHDSTSFMVTVLNGCHIFNFFAVIDIKQSKDITMTKMIGTFRLKAAWRICWNSNTYFIMLSR